MASPSVFLLAVLGAGVVLIYAQQLNPIPPMPKECGQNQEYKACGSACPPTCSNFGPRICTQQCVSGCFCKQGYLLLDKMCIKENLCRSCKGNTTYTNCVSACPGTCSNGGNVGICIKKCTMGCVCKPGYVLRNVIDKSSCILLKDCPPNTLV